VARVWACLLGNGKELHPADLKMMSSVMLHRLTKRAPEDRLGVMFFREEARQQEGQSLLQILDEVLRAV
jgi:hypothetical protein